MPTRPCTESRKLLRYITVSRRVERRRGAISPFAVSIPLELHSQKVVPRKFHAEANSPLGVALSGLIDRCNESPPGLHSSAVDEAKTPRYGTCQTPMKWWAFLEGHPHRLVERENYTAMDRLGAMGPPLFAEALTYSAGQNPTAPARASPLVTPTPPDLPPAQERWRRCLCGFFSPTGTCPPGSCWRTVASSLTVAW